MQPLLVVYLIYGLLLAAAVVALVKLDRPEKPTMTPLNTITDAELRELFLLVNRSYNQKEHARRDRTLIKAEQKLSDERALRRRAAIPKAGRRIFRIFRRTI
jgi:hypothetical protein